MPLLILYPQNIFQEGIDKTAYLCYAYVMPEPKMELAKKYRTSTQARLELSLSRWEFDTRIARGIFPRPTYIDTVQRGDVILKVRYFDESWIQVAKTILDNEWKSGTV